MLPIFFGHDERTAAGTTVFLHSVIRNARGPVRLTPIARATTPACDEGSNAFTMRRFLVPWLQDFRGWAVFVDGADMLCRSDINEIMLHADPYKAVLVVKHDYKTRHPSKYIGTPMMAPNADYERKQWASVMLINCSHYAWRDLTPTSVASAGKLDLLQLRFIPDERIGDLPAEWNWLCDEHGSNSRAHLLHFTAGVPAFAAHAGAPMADEWRAELVAACTATG